MLYFLYEVFAAAWGLFYSKHSQTNYQESQNPASTETNPIRLSFQTIIDDIAFAYIKREVAAKNKWVAFYNFHFFFRWALYSFLVTIWYNNPRTIYSIFLGYNFLQYIYTFYVWVIGGFNRPAGFYIFFSELCIFCRHMSGFSIFVDFFGSQGMAKSTV